VRIRAIARPPASTATGHALRPDVFRQCMQRFCSGVALVTVARRRIWSGLAVSSLASVSANPPTVLVCVNRKASAHAALLASEAFAVNLLGEAHSGLVEDFSDPARRAARFRSPDWTVGQLGAPVLRTAAAVLECSLAEQVEWGTHTVLFGQVMEGWVGSADAPLVYGLGGVLRLVTPTGEAQNA